MAVTDLTGTKWRANCLTIGEYDSFPDPADSDAVPFVNVIDEEAPEPNPGEVIPIPAEIGLYVRYDDPYEGLMYIPYEDVPYPDSPEDDKVDPPVSDIYTYVANESAETILLTFNEDLASNGYSLGNITWLETYATQIQDEPSNPISIGNLPIANMYFGTRQVKKVYLGNALVWEKEATIIEFSIGTSSYQAVEGMTWGEWCASEYNTGGLVVVNGVVRTYNSPTAYPVYSGNPQDVVYSSDVIIANRPYLVDTGGGSN